jgi:hypothetical protein
MCCAADWLQRSTEQQGWQSGSKPRNARLKLLFSWLSDFQLSGCCANKAFAISSVRWVMAGYNVTDDTARY